MYDCIIVDSGCDLPDAIKEKDKCGVIPLKVFSREKNTETT
jgi:fatty acid-binding protein DegV